MRYGWAASWTAFVASCLVACAPTQPDIEQFGAMRDVMREGHTEPRISLEDVVAQPHAFAVGALAGLAGEITIVDGDVWVSRVADGGLYVTGPEATDGDQATLLTLSYAGKWRDITIEKAVEGPALEAFIEQTARMHGTDTAKPFPFVIEGRLANLDLHVINGYCPIATDPATVDAQPWRWSNSRPTDVTIVGFYAPDAAGVMTHHGTSIHAHAILSVDDEILTGHVDRLALEPGMTLRISTED